jgi:hypothetical protein
VTPIVQERFLITEYQVRRTLQSFYRILKTKKIIAVSPHIVIIEKAQILSSGGRRADVHGIALTVPIWPLHEKVSFNRPSRSLDDRFVFRNELLARAIIDYNYLDGLARLIDDRLQSAPEQDGPIAGGENNRKEGHRPTVRFAASIWWRMSAA